MKRNYLFCVCIIVAIFTGCNKKESKYSIDHYFNKSQQDTLLVDIVSYIGQMPIHADWKTRRNPVYRKSYIVQAPQYHFVHYFISDDSTHYFYIIRPARSSKGNQRGVGGKFHVRNGSKIYDFEETFNTPPGNEQELLKIGRLLFQELIQSGNVDIYLNIREYVEWPDKQTIYDKNKNEWMIGN